MLKPSVLPHPALWSQYAYSPYAIHGVQDVNACREKEGHFSTSFLSFYFFQRGEGHSALVRIRGVVRQSESPSSFVPPNSPETGEWFYIHIPQIARELGLPDETILVDAVREEGRASTFPSAKELSEHVKQSVMPEKHLSYAATWYVRVHVYMSSRINVTIIKVPCC